jgi:hypothetical protein
MNDDEEHILSAIKTFTWAGFYTRDDISEMVEELIEDLEEGDTVDEEMLRAALESEWEKKQAAEDTWSAQTDCDRLDHAFNTLNTEGIIALQNAGYTLSDGFSDLEEVLAQKGHEGIEGFCFYHGQDLERAVGGKGLMLAFGDLNDDVEATIQVGNKIKRVLEANGFIVDWEGEVKTRIALPSIDWKRRSPV